MVVRTSWEPEKLGAIDLIQAEQCYILGLPAPLPMASERVRVCRRLESTGAVDMAKREPPVIHCNTGDTFCSQHSC